MHILIQDRNLGIILNFFLFRTFHIQLETKYTLEKSLEFSPSYLSLLLSFMPLEFTAYNNTDSLLGGLTISLYTLLQSVVFLECTLNHVVPLIKILQSILYAFRIKSEL